MASDSKSILDPAAILSTLPTLLPQNSKSLTSPHDAIAALVHTILSAVAFRLISVDDTSNVTNSDTNVLPEGWNKNGPGSYTLRYKHNQSSLEFLVKISKLGNRTVINAIAVEVCGRSRVRCLE
jgi:proteasome inhibitor subunit 1 (PI31)